MVVVEGKRRRSSSICRLSQVEVVGKLILLVFCCPTRCNGLSIANNEEVVADRNKKSLFDRRNAINAIAMTSTFCAAGLLIPTPAAMALSPEEASTAYDSYAKTYDDLDGGEASSLLGIDEARNALLGQASGSVLEIGAGTGLNLNKYDLTKVTSITLVDVSDGMLNEARNRVKSIPSLQGIPISYVNADATSALVDRFGEQKFDCVTDSFSLCVMGTMGAKKCLDQLSRVVKRKSDGGKVLLLENSRSSNPLLGAYQDATADIAASSGGKGTDEEKEGAKSKCFWASLPTANMFLNFKTFRLCIQSGCG